MIQIVSTEIKRLVCFPPNRTIFFGPSHIGKRKLIKNEIVSIVSSEDFLEVDGSIDGARQVQQFLGTFPINGNAKVVLIDCKNFTEPSQDAYLKTCEDNTESSVIIMITDDLDIRSSLLSRLDVIRLFDEKNESEEFISKVFKNKSKSAEMKNHEENLFKFYGIMTKLSDESLITEIPEMILNWSSFDDDLKSAVLSVCEMSARINNDKSVEIYKFVNVMKLCSSANAEIHWCRHMMT